VVKTKYLAKFQSPRAITRPKIIGPQRNVNLICNLSLYTHIPNIKSISQSIAKKLFYFGIMDMDNTIVYMSRSLSGGDIKKRKLTIIDSISPFPSFIKMVFSQQILCYIIKY
jgi:hypothetical protein